MDLKKDLRKVLSSGRATLFIGSGVSISATYGASHAKYASWKGLISNGLNYVIKSGKKNKAWMAEMNSLLDTNDAETYIEVAESLENAMGAADFRKWMAETVGELKAHNTDVLDRIFELVGDNIVMTTNYDDLLEGCLGWGTVDWTMPHHFQDVLLGKSNAILHLHGHWDKPESIVFGKRSYNEISKNPNTQFLFKNTIQSRSLVFIGCGETIFDYNVGTALKTAINEMPIDLNLEHYWLVLDGEDKSNLYKRLNTEFGREHRIRVVAYGEKHDLLSGYLGNLITKESNSLKQKIVDPPNSISIESSLFRYLFNVLTPDKDVCLKRFGDLQTNIESFNSLIESIESIHMEYVHSEYIKKHKLESKLNIYMAYREIVNNRPVYRMAFGGFNKDSNKIELNDSSRCHSTYNCGYSTYSEISLGSYPDSPREKEVYLGQAPISFNKRVVAVLGFSWTEVPIFEWKYKQFCEELSWIYSALFRAYGLYIQNMHTLNDDETVKRIRDELVSYYKIQLSSTMGDRE